MAQAGEIAKRLAAIGEEGELVPMVTSGDRGASAGKSPAGMKGLFVAEIVGALQRGEVDLAVHSAKDLPTGDPEGIAIGAVPERTDPFDVLVRRGPDPLSDGAVVGTSSLRRRAQLARARPGLRVVSLRGNVDTRLAKLEDGEVDGLVLAAAGLERLGVRPAHLLPLPLEEMVPAPGQGALAVQVREDDRVTQEIVARLDHAPSRRAFEAERALVMLVGGGCALPLGAYAEDREGRIRLIAVVAQPDGSEVIPARAEAPTPEEAAQLAADLLLAGGAGEILASALRDGWT